MDTEKISLIFCGTPSDRTGFRTRFVGFLENANDGFIKYIELDGEVVPKKTDEVLRIVKTSFKGRKMTVALTYRFINPNDVAYNRGAFFGCGIAVLGDVGVGSAVAMSNVLSELHGYMSSFMDSERFCFRSDFDIDNFNIRQSPALGRISPSTEETLFSGGQVDGYYLHNQQGQLDLANAICLVNNDEGNPISNRGIDMIIADMPFKGYNRKVIDMTFIAKIPERISLEGELVDLKNTRNRMNVEIISYRNELKKENELKRNNAILETSIQEKQTELRGLNYEIKNRQSELQKEDRRLRYIKDQVLYLENDSPSRNLGSTPRLEGRRDNHDDTYPVRSGYRNTNDIGSSTVSDEDAEQLSELPSVFDRLSRYVNRLAPFDKIMATAVIAVIILLILMFLSTDEQFNSPTSDKTGNTQQSQSAAINSLGTPSTNTCNIESEDNSQVIDSRWLTPNTCDKSCKNINPNSLDEHCRKCLYNSMPVYRCEKLLLNKAEIAKPSKS